MSHRFLSSPRRVATLPALASIFLGLTFSAFSQSAESQVVSQISPRIQGPVNPDVLTTLRGNTSPLANARNDHGRVPDATPTGRLLLQLKPSAEQKTALDNLITAQLNPKSPSFHKWLTPDTFGKQFGATDADIQTVTAYLSQQGFSVSRVLPNKLSIEFSGTTDNCAARSRPRSTAIPPRGRHLTRMIATRRSPRPWHRSSPALLRSATTGSRTRP